MSRLSNKKALVTGSSRGIGKAIAIQLASEGAEVLVHYHQNREEGEAVVSDIIKGGGKAYLLQADIGDTQQAIKLGEEAWDKLGGIDFLINNAGISYKKHFLDTTEADVAAFLSINFIGTFFLTQTIAARMVASERAGSIMTVTSVNGIRPGLGLSAYGASKGALETVMKGAAMELAPHRISVNTIAVGAVETDLTMLVRENPALYKEVAEGIPMGRFGQPEEVAAVVCDLLASGSYLTGSTVTLDGGLLLMRGYGKVQPHQKPL